MEKHPAGVGYYYLRLHSKRADGDLLSSLHNLRKALQRLTDCTLDADLEALNAECDSLYADIERLRERYARLLSGSY